MANFPNLDQIQNVSDTAWIVAAMRAEESERPDALIHDPYARTLVGEKGSAILKDLSGSADLSWLMGVRTAALDDFILRLVEKKNLDCIVNLASGLDTRPYRLDLPPSLTWYDVDLEPVITYKRQHLASAVPRCMLNFAAVDLANAPLRRQFLANVAKEHQSILVMTEGLLPYLSEKNIQELSEDLLQTPGLNWWLMDLLAEDEGEEAAQEWRRILAEHHVDAPFFITEGTKFFERMGWKVANEKTFRGEAQRFGRDAELASLAVPTPDPILAMAKRLLNTLYVVLSKER